jgi:mono/diheme cytochrome c family protein
VPRRRRNPWTFVGELLVWVLFAALLFPAAFAGWAIGHYTSLGGESGRMTTVTQTVTVSVSAGAAKTTTATPAGNAAAGKTLFTANGCASCHRFKAADSTGAFGPDLDTAPTQDAKKAGEALPAFVEQSILDPNAYVASGYPKNLMPSNFGKRLSKSQIQDLVAFVVSGQR